MNIKGIDVSVWQGKIDWKKVKASGIVFAMIRVGYGSSQGNDCKMDTYFKANVEGALAAGVEVGIYFYSYHIFVDTVLGLAERSARNFGIL